MYRRIDDRLMLARVGGPLVHHLPDIDGVGQDAVEVPLAEGSITADPLARSQWRALIAPIQLSLQPLNGAELQVELEDLSHALRLCFVDDQRSP